jgi:hypothetical protein
MFLHGSQSHSLVNSKKQDLLDVLAQETIGYDCTIKHLNEDSVKRRHYEHLGQDVPFLKV